MLRTILAGGPRVGKTTLSRALAAAVDVEALHTDDLLGQEPELTWSEVHVTVAGWMDLPGPWVIEGVATPRALRTWLRAHANDTTAPADRVFWSVAPKVTRTKHQEAMTRGIESVWAEVEPELVARGVVVQRF